MSGKLEQTICCGRCLLYGKERIITWNRKHIHTPFICPLVLVAEKQRPASAALLLCRLVGLDVLD